MPDTMTITPAETLDGIEYATTENICRVIKRLQKRSDTNTFLDSSTLPTDFKLMRDTKDSEQYWIHNKSDGTTRADISILCVVPTEFDNYRTQLSAKGNMFVSVADTNDTKVLFSQTDG